MTWPIDVFYASIEDARTFVRDDAGEPPTKHEKLKALRDKAKAKAKGGSEWWSK